jgi:DNA repair protein RecO (recombination protein O)
MFLKIKGLVLKETRIKDADKFLTLLTAEQGVMTVKARGVMRKSSRLSSGCQLFCYSDFTLFEGKSVTSVNAAEPINMFLGLRADAEKLALAAYFAELLDALGKTDGDTGELLRLGLNAFYALSELDKPLELVRAAFEMRAMAESGYAPNLSGCHVCGEENPPLFLFHLNSGALCCESCRPKLEGGLALPCPPPVRAALRRFCFAPMGRLLSVNLPPSILPALCGITEAFCLTQLEKNFKTLDYYKGLVDYGRLH